MYMSSYFTAKVKREIGRKLSKRRKELGLTQVEVAVDSGINSSYYSKIERGEVNTSLEILYKLIKSLKLKSSDILPF